MSLLLVSPLAVPMGFAALGLLLPQPRLRQAVSLAGAGLLTACTLALLVGVLRDGPKVLQVGGWPAPFGITLVCDGFSAVMLAIASLIGLCGFIYSVAGIDPLLKSFTFHPLLHVLMMGVCGAFLAGDLFNLYVWFEVMLIASFVLLSLGGTRAQLEGAVKYLTLNLLASALFLAGVGLLYALMGTLNLADLAVKLRQTSQPGLVTAISMLLLGAFGIKAAVFPLFFWLPAAYHTPPVTVSAVFAGLLTKVGVYTLIRVFTLLFVQDLAFTRTLLLWVAGLTMLSGVLGAAAQMDLRRILAFHIVSQIGYLVMGLALFTTLGLAGTLYFLVHNILVKTNLFLVAGMVGHLEGTYELKALGGLYRSRPWLSVLFLISAFSLAGLPPLSGFFGKLTLLRAGLALEQYLLVGVAAVVSLLTLFSMTKIWGQAFWKERPSTQGPPRAQRLPISMLLPSVLLTLLTLLLGFLPGPALAVSTQVAQDLLSIGRYLQAVQGAAP